MIDITEISAAVAAGGVLVGVLYYILDLRHQNRVRETDLIMRLHSQSSGKEMIEAAHILMTATFESYEDFVKKYGPIVGTDPVAIAYGMVTSFYEGVGILVHRRLADVDLIYELFPAKAIWRKVEPLVMSVRKQYGIPELLEWFEYLYNELQKREQKFQQRGET